MKPIIMILGSSHLANPGWDGVNPKIDDVLVPKRQTEIEQLVAQLGKFQPTKIALEIDVSRDAEINASYQGYLEGTYELKRYESDQIGFRLAKQMEHPKVYCVDYFREDPIVQEDIDERLVDYDAFAEANGQKHLLSSPSPTEGKITKDAEGRTWIVREKYEPMIDMYIRINQDEGIRKNLRDYLRIARIGLQDEYPGANWVAHAWYPRNLKIFVNLTRITELENERILLIIGAGHLGFLKQIVEDSEVYNLESPLEYLETGEAEMP